jgi:hypothetical protein
MRQACESVLIHPLPSPDTGGVATVNRYVSYFFLLGPISTINELDELVAMRVAPSGGSRAAPRDLSSGQAERGVGRPRRRQTRGRKQADSCNKRRGIVVVGDVQANDRCPALFAMTSPSSA